MTPPWIPVEPLEAERFEGFRRRAIFACRKWDAQVGDVTTVADRPLVIDPAEWEIVRDLAEALARETDITLALMGLASVDELKAKGVAVLRPA